MEVLENVCDSFYDYALTQSALPGAKRDNYGVTRVKKRGTGEQLDIGNVVVNENLKSTFKSYVSSKAT